jgi:small-conductance mechanosensitive channel
MLKRIHLAIFLVAWMMFATHGFAQPFTQKITGGGKKTANTGQENPVTLPENYTAEQINGILARMSDDQVRRLLIEELQKTADAQENKRAAAEGQSITGFFYRVENVCGFAISRIITLAYHVKNIPQDLGQILDKLAEGKGISHLFLTVLILIVLLFAGFGIERLFHRFTTRFRQKIESTPPMEGLLKFWSALLKTLPELVGILLFGISSLVLYFLIYGVKSGSRPLFLACVAALLIARLLSSFSRMLCSPSVPRLRLISLSDQGAKDLHRNLVPLIWYIALGYMTIVLFTRLQLAQNSFEIFVFAVVTVLTLMIAGMIWKSRSAVRQALVGDETRGAEGKSWLKEQVAGIWYVFAFAYLILMWLVWSGRLIILGPTFDFAFIISLLIVPIFIAVDRAALWIIRSTVADVQIPLEDSVTEIADSPEAIEGGDLQRVAATREEQALIGPEAEQPADRYVRAAHKITRAIIILAMAFWMMRIWGFEIPFGTALMNATFDIFITLGLAHIVWGFTTKLIHRKIQESLPDKTEEDDDEGDEWGGAAYGRGYTLLPLIQKFIGIVLVVMVTMIILSSLGVNIGPLLAGAGVIGLAIGFGSQKLVSDILTGLFYLIDDAIRVGEYVQAGSVSGTVEKITLRTLNLRHHRGMLQIIPFSDLGPITNFMRGGLVVKFDIVLPYDTSIDKVRKIIKKVGQGMMQEEEWSKDMIQPVKSQGVRSVGDSVMTFRVKFKAKPGRHFMIRREAFRRITEALEAQGFHYAHRKVIVESPAEKPAAPDAQTVQKLKAGAAAALETIVDQQKEQKQS